MSSEAEKTAYPGEWDEAPTVEEIQGDVFVLSQRALDAHVKHGVLYCSSRDAKMEYGFPKDISRAYGVVEDASDGMAVGRCRVRKAGDRILFGAVIKAGSRDIPTNDACGKAFASAFRGAAAEGVRIMYMPRVACGANRRDWVGFVRPLLEELAKKYSIVVRVAAHKQ